MLTHIIYQTPVRTLCYYRNMNMFTNIIILLILTKNNIKNCAVDKVSHFCLSDMYENII